MRSFLADKRAHLQYIHFLTLSVDALRPVGSARNGIHFGFCNAFAHHVGLGLSLFKKSLSSFAEALTAPETGNEPEQYQPKALTK